MNSNIISNIKSFNLTLNQVNTFGTTTSNTTQTQSLFGNNTTNTSNSTASTQAAIPSASPALFVFGGGQSIQIFSKV